AFGYTRIAAMPLPDGAMRVQVQSPRQELRDSFSWLTPFVGPSIYQAIRPGRSRQGDRILSCSGEHRQQVVFVETTEQSFLSQTPLMCMLLPQQIEGNVSHRRHICGGMVLPDAAAIFIERDI